MMKDITRIHIAKVPYSIELSAKKNLEKYINALELYTGDHEVLEDIEIRITELLLERGVKQESVISDADVAAVRAQLGEPKDFMSEDGVDVVDPELLSENAPRKLYRNLDTAILGGVLSGVASFFQINSLWVRLAFIVLIFVSFGLSALLYVVLWLIVPPARTAAEKLQMAGRSVTLSSIRELNESDTSVDVEKRTRILKRIATTTLGIFSIGGALASVATLVAFTVEIVLNQNNPSYTELSSYQFSIILAYAAGVLLTAFFLLVAIASFTQKFNKRIWISGLIIILLGLGTFGTAVSSAVYQNRLQFEEVERNTVDASIKLPENFAGAKTLSVDVPTATSVVYVVEGKDFSIKQRALKDAPKATITVENGEMKVKLAESKVNNMFGGPTITIYGPQLDSIIASNGYVSYNSGTQTAFKAEVYNSASLRLIGSRIDELTVKTDSTGQLSADEAAVASVKATVLGQSSVSLGNIKTLNVTNPDVCAAYQVANLSIQNIISSTFTHNGFEAGAKSTEGPCLQVEFASSDDEEYGYQR